MLLKVFVKGYRWLLREVSMYLHRENLGLKVFPTWGGGGLLGAQVYHRMVHRP